jgi:hypothetical protein
MQVMEPRVAEDAGRTHQHLDFLTSFEVSVVPISRQTVQQLSRSSMWWSMYIPGTAFEDH